MRTVLSSLLALLVLVAAYALSSSSSVLGIYNGFMRRVLSLSRSSPTARTTSSSAEHTLSTNMTRLPVYFMSHGSPAIMFQTEHPLYSSLQDMGREINKLKPDAVVIVSAHWEARPGAVEVNVDEDDELLYDYYGFPPEFYKAKFPHRGSKEVAQKIIATLTDAGIDAVAVKRPIDHGVFSPFIAAFPASNPLTVPLVQLSLYTKPSAPQHWDLGRALAPLRGQNIVLVGSGAAVHNLRDYMFSGGDMRPQPYAKSFDDALTNAVVQSAAAAPRHDAMLALLDRPDARKAHPTLEHLWPVYVAAGAAEDDQASQIASMLEGSFSWSCYRFGELPAAAS